jgi:hypothetical protein
MTQQTIQQLPLEGRNVVHLLSLQPGAVFIPRTTEHDRARRGRGARADQQNVTLDGIDVNDRSFRRLHVGRAHDAGSAAGVPGQHEQLRRGHRPLERRAGVARHRSGTNTFTGSDLLVPRGRRRRATSTS